jgi:superfamily II DNA or RNA helicase
MHVSDAWGTIPKVATFQALLSRLDSDPGIRGQQFERICKWFLETDPVYAAQLKHVWLWKDWPGRWGADAGIDLVAETTDGKLWAIQAKAYAPEYRIKKSDVDTFLSESSRPEFSYRLLMATTNHVGKTALRTLEAQEKPAYLSLLGDLKRASVDWPTSPERLAGRPAKPKKPRAHQERAVRDVLRGFEGQDRGRLVMACGTGKTLVALWLAESMRAQRTLVLMPSLSLLAQTLREWRANATRPFEALPVCSDETVRGKDLLISHTSDLPFPVTTDAGEIAAFLRKRGPRVVFSTYQSSPKIAEAFAAGRVPAFDLAIADEAHRVAGSLAKDFGTILDDGAIHARRRLFMTATPRYVKSWVRHRAEESGIEVASMDDPERFGPVLHQLTFGEAIERKLLSDYQVAVVAVDDETAREQAERGTFVTIGNGMKTDARTLAAQIGLARAMRKWDLRRIVSFHSRVDWARRFADAMPEVVRWMPAEQRPKGALWGDHVSGAMPSGERDVRLDRLRGVGPGERGLLSNARCLAEGVDVPTLDGVAFIDPRRSEVDVVQAVGRAIRKAEDKTLGTVVLPVFVVRGEDAEATVETSSFDHVWQVLNALRSHDEVLAEELDALRRELGRRGSLGRRPGKIHLVGMTKIGPEFARAFDARLVEATTRSWEFRFGMLQRFVEREGHARVPGLYRDESGCALGSWVNEQRTAYGRDALSEERIARLEALPGWVWEPFDDAWEQGFDALRRFIEREGHARVPQGFRDEDGYRLGHWVGTQRTVHGRGVLSEERVTRLEALPGWVWDTIYYRWEQGFDALQRFIEREGHARVSAAYRDEGGYLLGRWTSHQRALYRTRDLSSDRVARLEASPGWVWEAFDDLWEQGFDALQRFVEREGHARVPFAYRDEGVLWLGSWVNTQRLRYGRGVLSKERIGRLEALPGWVWEPHDDLWEQGFDALERFVAREGHARVPAAYRDGLAYPLGHWVNAQRTRCKRGVLSEERIARLEASPGWVWEAHVDRWEQGFDALKRFVAREGHARVVPTYRDENGYRLGGWVHSQRSAYRRGELSEERIARLAALPGWAWDEIDYRWEQGFDALKRFVAREGHARVPQGFRDEGGYLLGRWTSHQRALYRTGGLSSDRVARLEALPGWVWEPHVDRWE